MAQGTGPVLLAGLDNGGIYASKDGGASWFSLGTPFTGGGRKVKAFVLSKDRKIVFGVIETFGVVRSDNLGQSWTQLNEGLPKSDTRILVRSLAVDPSNPKNLYAGTGGFVGQGSGVYKSGDGGETWSASNQGMLDVVIDSLAVDPANGQVVYAGSEAGDLFKSTDSGKSWTNLNDTLKAVFPKYAP